MALCHSGILQSLKFRHILGQSEKTKERDISQKTRKGGEGMTRGFFVFEENYSVKKAVELSGSAYLQDGYGEEIVRRIKMERKNHISGLYASKWIANKKRNY